MGCTFAMTKCHVLCYVYHAICKKDCYIYSHFILRLKAGDLSKATQLNGIWMRYPTLQGWFTSCLYNNTFSTYVVPSVLKVVHIYEHDVILNNNPAK